MAPHLDSSNSPNCRMQWLPDEGLPGYPYPVVVNNWCAMPAAHQCLWLPVNPLVWESVCSLLTFLQPHLQTQVATKVSLCSHFRLCGLSWCPPRDAKIVMCAANIWHWQRPHASTTIDAVHKGTNRKAQQSCGGGTSWGVSGTPGLSWNTWACVSEHTWWNNTQVNALNTVEGSRLQSQGCTWRVSTYACFEQSNLLKVLGNRTNPFQVQPLLYQKVMWHAQGGHIHV